MAVRKAVKEHKILKQLGPGLITGVSDDDPSGIATYSQIGAQFGFSLLWTMVFSYPLMVAIQEICARIGRVTGAGIAGNMKSHYPRWILYPVVFTLLAVNIINIGADLQAMGAALNLIIGGSVGLYCILFAVTSLVLQVFIPYSRYVRWLKWLTLSLFAYVGTVLIVKIDWLKVAHATLLPTLSMNKEHMKLLTATLGTTISPYLFFWQASQEVEEEMGHRDQHSLRNHPLEAPAQFERIRIDTYVGMAFSNIIAFFIILTTAATLYAHGITDIKSAADAAEALRPVAGNFCFLLFSLGIIGSGLLAVPVLAGSAAYASAESMGWKIGLEKRVNKAKAFYSVIALATLTGLVLTLLDVDPIKALIWTAVLNGVVSGPIMAVIMLIASNKNAMGPFTLKPGLKIMGWLSTLAMFAVAVGLFLTGP